ncbi:MAG: hypothetical protein JST16_17975 [Bdellovibrionales bacterium]|nr:hypothetical protein [Bdellovibrionales bacterium]
MQTDEIPDDKAEREEYWRSDSLHTVALPPPDRLRRLSLDMKAGLAADDKKVILTVCKEMLKELSDFYEVDCPTVSILAKRPLKPLEEGYVQELFGDYTPDTQKIRLWMRTAVQKKPTSHGVLLSTFVHEFIHHLDIVQMDFPESFHTRGFYDRVGLIYHHIQNTPVRKIVWRSQKDGTYLVDWARTMANR